MLFLINQDNDNRNNKLNRVKFEIKILIKINGCTRFPCLKTLHTLSHSHNMTVAHYTCTRQNIYINLYYFVVIEESINTTFHISFSTFFPNFSPYFIYTYASIPQLINQLRLTCINIIRKILRENEFFLFDGSLNVIKCYSKLNSNWKYLLWK